MASYIEGTVNSFIRLTKNRVDSWEAIASYEITSRLKDVEYICYRMLFVGNNMTFIKVEAIGLSHIIYIPSKNHAYYIRAKQP